MMRKTMTLLMVLVMMMALAACSAEVGDTVSGSSSNDRMATPEASAIDADEAHDLADEAEAGSEEREGGEVVSLTAPSGRKVIQRAAITIEAAETRTVFDAIQQLVADSGGFLESANVADPLTGEDQPRIDMVLRVPAADLPGTLEAIADLATRVVSQSQRGQDVTEEYVDVEARITNLTMLETELRALLEEVRAQPDADPDKLLRVFNEISNVRGQIEQLEGRRQVLNDLTSLATVEVEVHPNPRVAPVVEEGWAPMGVARDALRSLVGAVQGIADAAITFVLYGLPLLVIVAGVPGFAAWKLWRRFGPARPTSIEPTE